MVDLDLPMTVDISVGDMPHLIKSTRLKSEFFNLSPINNCSLPLNSGYALNTSFAKLDHTLSESDTGTSFRAR